MIKIINKLIYKYINTKLNFKNTFKKKIKNITNIKKINTDEIDFLEKLIYRICLENANPNIPSSNAFYNSLLSVTEFYENSNKSIDVSDYIIFYNNILDEFNDYIFYLKLMQRVLNYS